MSDGGWNTIDSDAGVFTELVEKLGVQDVQFDDLFAIDSDSLKELGPLYGVIFLFKYGSVDRSSAQNGNQPLDGVYDEKYQDKGVFFANQMIQNACATQAVLNVLLNQLQLELGEELTNFREFVKDFDGEICGSTISNSELIRKVHNSFSPPTLFVDEDKSKPPPDYDDRNDGLFHFIGYLNIKDQIYELDGLKQFPILHGPCNSNEQFYEKLPDIIRSRISKYADELRFSLLAISPNKLNLYESIGDQTLFQRELMKRETWAKENELRRHDHLGLLVELIKNVSQNTSDEEWNEKLNQAKRKSQAKLLQSFMSTKN